MADLVITTALHSRPIKRKYYILKKKKNKGNTAYSKKKKILKNYFKLLKILKNTTVRSQYYSIHFQMDLQIIPISIPNYSLKLRPYIYSLKTTTYNYYLKLLIVSVIPSFFATERNSLVRHNTRCGLSSYRGVEP